MTNAGNKPPSDVLPYQAAQSGGDGLQPLAQYREWNWGNSREFSLLADRIIIKVRHISGRGTTLPILLAHLDHNYYTQQKRPNALKNSFTLAVVAFGFAAVIHFGKLLDALPPWVLWLALGLGAIGSVFTAMAFPLIEYVFFRGRGRPELALMSIGRIGPDRAAFEQFVAAVVRQIGIAQDPRSTAPILGGSGWKAS